MIIIFSTRSAKVDYQVGSLASELAKRHVPHIVLNSHSLAESRIVLLQRGSDLELYSSSEQLFPSAFYLSRLWRTDCIAAIPAGVNYPGVFRVRIH